MIRLARITLFLCALCLLVSCKKDHYNVGNVHGINAEGEVLAPLASASYTVRDLMERFELQEWIDWNSEGNMSLHYEMDMDSVLTGDGMLRFKDVDYHENYTYINPYTILPPPYVDTTLSFERTITFESEHIFVMEGWVKSGYFDFEVTSNAGTVRHVVLRSPNIKDEEGQDFVLDIPVYGNTFGFDLTGKYYTTDEANTLTILYEVTVNSQSTHDPELYLDVDIMGRDLAFSEMRGFVEQYDRRDRIDTLFTIFPALIDGVLEVEDVRFKVSERNTFALGARFVLDTLTMWSDALSPCSIFESLPLPIEMPPSLQYGLALDRTVNGRVNAVGGRLLVSGDFIVNPEGVTEMVTVVDTSRIDLHATVDLPFSFNVDDITYLDTVNMDVANLEMPDLIEELTLELTFSSMLPFDLNASFYMYNSEYDMVMDTLIADAVLIKASFDGRPATTEVTLFVNEDRVDNVLHSDRIIMLYQLDSEGREVDLNIEHRLDLSLKGRAKYNGIVEFEN